MIYSVSNPKKLSKKNKRNLQNFLPVHKMKNYVISLTAKEVRKKFKNFIAQFGLKKFDR
jgi:hypothetical protein